MRIAIIGTRGIPNNYGGFEQLAQYLSLGLIKKGHEVFVYSSSKHSYTENTWNDIHIIHCFDPERKIGTAGQFIYDFNCILDARKRKFDAILNLGYTSSSVWMRLFPRKAKVITNMDGLEWKRSKYSKKVQKFLKYAEKWAVLRSNALVADSLGIQEYLNKKYNVKSQYIAYGADLFESPEEKELVSFNILPYQYNMLIARMEPENNIEMILDGAKSSSSPLPFFVVGNASNKFGRYLTAKFSSEKRIVFTGPIYDTMKINNLRYFSNLYFHGHSVGGTNPSLLEAMACKSLVAAHYNDFNKGVLGEDAYYFENDTEVKDLISTISKNEERSQNFVNKNFQKISKDFTWQKIIEQYEEILTAK